MDRLDPARGAVFRLEQPEDVGALRRAAGRLAREFVELPGEWGRVELAATELGTNLVNHAPGTGLVLVQPTPEGAGVELLAIDRGPGIADLQAALQGPSPAEIERRLDGEGGSRRGLGCGLASVKRLASRFDVHSLPGQGTVVLARFCFGPPAPPSRFRCGAVSVPLIGEEANGDAWAFQSDGACCSALLVDGLGHGPGAAAAAQAALACFRRDYRGDLERFLRDAHEALRSTRGGAASVMRLDADRDQILFAGVGNVEGRLRWSGGSLGLTPRNGTLGAGLYPPAIRVQEGRCGPGTTLLVYSDGLRGHVEPEPGLLRHDPAVIAAVLCRDLARGRDDATMLVIQR